MITYRDLMIESERRLEEILRAREARLIRQFSAGAKGSDGRYRRLMNSLGAQLISWGSSLQSRYPSRPVEAGAWRPNGSW